MWLLICFAAAAIGSVASVQAISFYTELRQPNWSPPVQAFGPVWSLLFVLMAISAWLVWCRGGYDKQKVALNIFMLQLAANALWSWLFFAWQNGALALVEVIVLWLLILTTIIVFWRVRPLAGALLVPYLLWVSFASALNYSLWQLNPTLLG